jgi:hypothetical protein
MYATRASIQGLSAPRKGVETHLTGEPMKELLAVTRPDGSADDRSFRFPMSLAGTATR